MEVYQNVTLAFSPIFLLIYYFSDLENSYNFLVNFDKSNVTFKMPTFVLIAKKVSTLLIFQSFISNVYVAFLINLVPKLVKTWQLLKYLLVSLK